MPCRLRHRLTLLLPVAALLMLAQAQPASAARHAPNLRVTSAKLTTSTSRVSVSATIRNSGSRAAQRSKLDLTTGKLRLARVTLGKLKTGRSRRVKLAAPLARLAAGSYRLRLCADATRLVRERSERDNCRVAGTLTISPDPDPDPASGVPSDPIGFLPGVRQYNAGAGGYWYWISPTYDVTHQTPTKLFVWFHGCSGQNFWDIYNVAPQADENYIAVAPDGAEYGCWNMDSDSQRAVNVIDNVATHFNIDRRRVVLGGYSSGADLSFRTAFFNSTRIAGILVENAAPFRDIGVSRASALAAAGTKFKTVLLAHTEDAVYPIEELREEVSAMQGAGFPVELVERAGNHWDNDDDVAGTGTVLDMRNILLPYLALDWTSPGS